MASLLPLLASAASGLVVYNYVKGRTVEAKPRQQTIGYDLLHPPALPPRAPITELFQGFMYKPHPRAAPYLDRIRAAESTYGIPANLLVRQLEHESAFFDPDVIACRRSSRVGAKGIAQIMPATAAQPGHGVSPVNPCNVSAAINFAGQYMRAMYRATGSWQLALAAYNAGLGAVRAHGGIPPFAETQNYVATIIKDVPVA